MTSSVSEKIYSVFHHYIRPVSRMMPDTLDSEERRRRYMTVFCALIGLPVLAYFSVLDIKAHETLGIFMDGGLALLLVIGIVLLARIGNGIWVYRAFIAGFTALCCYNALAAPSGDSSMLWVLLYPPLVFFILGLREGLYWFAGMSLVNIVIAIPLAGPVIHVYSEEMRLRFFIVYIIIAFFTLVYELLRGHFQRELMKRSIELQSALEKVRTLSGLVPICSICKRIRDDKGYWTQLEDYLVEHTEAVMTHGICDSCMRTHYPEVYEKRTERVMHHEHRH